MRKSPAFSVEAINRADSEHPGEKIEGPDQLQNRVHTVL